jgi:hypothetical protein
LERLSADDRSLDVRRLTGGEHFRLRVGDWRVIFDYDRATQTVLVRHVLPAAGHTSDSVWLVNASCKHQLLAETVILAKRCASVRVGPPELFVQQR